MSKKIKKTNAESDLLSTFGRLCSASELQESPVDAGASSDVALSEKRRRRSAVTEEQEVCGDHVLGYQQRQIRLQDSELADDDLDQSGQTEFNQLFAKGVYLLGMREHSIQELTNKLNARTEYADIVLAVIDELLANNYLSDERFAESYVRSRSNRGFGPIKIQAEMKSKGVSQRLINEYLESGSAFWFDVAREQYKKKYRSKEVTDYKEWTKRARFLQSRGFNMEHIQAVQPSSNFY